MITVTCKTTDYAVLKAVSELFAKLTELGVPPKEVAAATGVKECVCAAAMPPIPEPVVTAPPIPEPVVTAPLIPEPVVTAPPIPEPVVTAPLSPIDLDGEGLPWDARIHASTKTRRQSDDTWKIIRGADKALIESVKAELRTLMTAPAAETAIAVTGGLSVPMTFGGLLQAFTFKQSAGKITADEMNAVCMGHGVASLALIGSRPELIPAIYADMEALCLTRA